MREPRRCASATSTPSGGCGSRRWRATSRTSPPTTSTTRASTEARGCVRRVGAARSATCPRFARPVELDDVLHRDRAALGRASHHGARRRSRGARRSRRRSGCSSTRRGDPPRSRTEFFDLYGDGRERPARERPAATPGARRTTRCAGRGRCGETDLDVLDHVNNADRWAAVEDELARAVPSARRGSPGAEIEYRGTGRRGRRGASSCRRRPRTGWPAGSSPTVTSGSRRREASVRGSGPDPQRADPVRDRRHVARVGSWACSTCIRTRSPGAGAWSPADSASSARTSRSRSPRSGAEVTVVDAASPRHGANPRNLDARRRRTRATRPRSR